MPNRRHNSRRFTPSCPNSTTNSCRCDMIDFSDHGIPASPPQAKDADSMCQPCLRTPVHYLPGLYSGGGKGGGEAFQWHGIKRGEAFAFYAGDIRVEGPHPFCSSGGNLGTGRCRTAMYTDSIEQLR